MSLSCLVDAAREKSVDHSSGATIVSSVAPLLRCTLELYAWGSSAAMMQLQQVHSACHERSRLRERQPPLENLSADEPFQHVLPLHLLPRRRLRLRPLEQQPPIRIGRAHV